MPQLAGFRGTLADSPRDPSRALYRYHQTFTHQNRSLTRKGVFAAIRLEPWGASVRPIEEAVPADREAELARITATKRHVAPVLAGYRDAAREVERLFRKTEAERPDHETTTADGVHHRVWRMASAETLGEVRKLFAPKKLIVLDGFARYEAMRAHAATLGELSMYAAGNYGLACLVELDDPALLSVPRHRVVRPFERDAVLAAASAQFFVEPIETTKIDAALADTAVAHQPALVAAFTGGGRSPSSSRCGPTPARPRSASMHIARSPGTTR